MQWRTHTRCVGTPSQENADIAVPVPASELIQPVREKKSAPLIKKERSYASSPVANSGFKPLREFVMVTAFYARAKAVSQTLI